MKKRKQKKKTLLKNPIFWVIVILLIGIVVVLIVYFTQPSTVTAPQPDPGPGVPLALGNGPAKITSWAWNSLVTGGFMGYGIFANKTNGYTWGIHNNSAVGNTYTLTDKWDEQGQNTTALHANDNNINLPTTTEKDSGSQFWDFISKKGSYQKTYGRQSLDGIKIQYDAAPGIDMAMTDRYKELLTNIKDEGLHVGILIGGKPKISGAAYHGITLGDMIKQINIASDWIHDNGMGDYIYVSLDIEPADSVLNNILLTGKTGAYAWYGAIFPQVATCIKQHTDKNVYYGMAINKNPYGDAGAYKAWSGLMSTNWVVDGKPRGFRVIELMYWWTAIDTQTPLNISHLASQLTTTVVVSNPVSDAVKYGLYLQFGLECTGEVAYLMFADTNPDPGTQCTTLKSCGTISTPQTSNCYRPQEGIIDMDIGIGFRCQNNTTTLPDGKTPSFSSDMKTDSKSEYWNTFKFNGNPKKYVPVYGFPYVAFPQPNSSSKYNFNECNALGKTGSTGGKNPEPVGKTGPPMCGTSMISTKSCDFLNKESWLLGGGLTTMSMEEFLHSSAARDWLISIVGSVSGHSTNPESIIFKIPFCVEDLSGYSGWLHDFKYGWNNTTPQPDLANFPDQGIKNGSANGSICMSRWRSEPSTENPKDQGDGNIPCLGQTALSYNADNKTFTTDWVAGTLEFNGKTWTCPNQDTNYYNQ